jgi:flagellar FliJ protein
MTDIQPLTLLLGQHERQRDAALAEHQRAIQAQADATAQAEQLRSYRREYEQRWSAQFQREGQMDLVHCYQSFTERLTQAVDQQAHIADTAAQRVERALVALREVELRCASVRKLIERRLHEQRADAERRDQKQSDELASRVAWNNRLGANGGPRLM